VESEGLARLVRVHVHVCDGTIAMQSLWFAVYHDMLYNC
jgi:hypothetical protein